MKISGAGKLGLVGLLMLITCWVLVAKTTAFEQKSVRYTLLDKAHTRVPCGKNNRDSCDVFYFSLQKSDGLPVVKTVNYESYSTLKVGQVLIFQEDVPGHDTARFGIGVLMTLGIALVLIPVVF